MEVEAVSFYRKHPGLLVLQSSLAIAGVIVIALSLSIPDRCVFGITSDHPSGRNGVCTFHSIVSFVGLLMAFVILVLARLLSSARDSYFINGQKFFGFSVACLLTTCLWFLDACLLSGYMDLTCSNVSNCRNVNGWMEGGWNVTGAWCSVALWFFACVVYAQYSRNPPDQFVSPKKFDEAQGQEDPTWTVTQAEIVKSPSAHPGHLQPSSETVTLKCNDPNPFTIVVHGVNEDGRQNYVPQCEHVTIDGERIHPRRYPYIIDALRKSVVPHRSDAEAVDRALLIMENVDGGGPLLPNSGLTPQSRDRADTDRGRSRTRDERKHSVFSSDQERMRQELIQTQRMNQALQRELEECKNAERREADQASGRQRAQSEQEKEASQLLQQMVELEALQQQQHAEQIAALERQIADLKRGQNGGHPAGKQVWEGD